MRKTIKVTEIKESVNQFLQDSHDDLAGNRRGAMMVLESILHSTGNYQGFGYLSEQDMSESIGTTVGINTVADADDADDLYNQRFENTDNTRVVYF